MCVSVTLQSQSILTFYQLWVLCVSCCYFFPATCPNYTAVPATYPLDCEHSLQFCSRIHRAERESRAQAAKRDSLPPSPRYRVRSVFCRSSPRILEQTRACSQSTYPLSVYDSCIIFVAVKMSLLFDPSCLELPEYLVTFHM